MLSTTEFNQNKLNIDKMCIDLIECDFVFRSTFFWFVISSNDGL